MSTGSSLPHLCHLCLVLLLVSFKGGDSIVTCLCIAKAKMVLPLWDVAWSEEEEIGEEE